MRVDEIIVKTYKVAVDGINGTIKTLPMLV
ncbi:MAG: hypothetical protein PWQ74_382 [Methanobacteriaceae archaeon]|nr:hypothetical protein [Methanobacteriaceae archaeon]